MRENITQLWGHIIALLFAAVLLLVGASFFQLQPLLSAVILSIFAAIYLAAALISRRSLTIYPGALLLVVAYNLVLYGLGVQAIFLPLASSPLVFILYLLARQLTRGDLGYVSGALNGSTVVVAAALALVILLQVGSYGSNAPAVASLTLIVLALHFVLRMALDQKTWHQWAFIVLVVPGYLFLLHGHTPEALYLASAVMLLVPAWNLIRKQMVGESALLITTALYVASAAFRQSPETLIPLGYAAAALALASLRLSQYRWLQDVVPALATGLVLTVIPVALTYPWNQYTALFPFLALIFFLYILSGSALLRRERTMIGLIAGHVHVAIGEVVALAALAYAAFEGFPLGYANALVALLMAAIAVLGGLRVSPILVKFRRHFFYLAGLFVTFGFLIALWRANLLRSTVANLSLTVVLLLLLYIVAEWGRSKVDQAGYETLLEVPAITAAIAGALYILGRSPGFSADLLLPVGLMLPGALVYWRCKYTQALASSLIGLTVLILATLMAAGASHIVAALGFLALGTGLAARQAQSGKGWTYVRLFALGVVTLASIGLSYPWGVPGVFVIGVWSVVYSVVASFLQTEERRVTRIGFEASAYALMLLSMAVLAAQVLLLPAAIIAALYALSFFVVTARNRQAAYLYPACGLTVLAVLLAARLAGLGTWYLLVAFPLTAIFHGAGAYFKSSSAARWETQATKPLYFGGHLNAAVGAVAFLLLATRLNDAVALVGVTLNLAAYAWMAYRRRERGFLAGVGLALSLLVLIGLSLLPFVERANVMGYLIPVALLLLGYGWLLERRGDKVGSFAILCAASTVALVSSGVALWGENLTLGSTWTVLIVGSLVWLGLLLLTGLDVFLYLITASLALLGYNFVRAVSDRFVNHVFIFLVYGCLLIALIFVYDLISRRMKFRAPIHFGQKILRRDWLVYGIPAVVLAGVALAGFGVESTSSPPFCNLCHTMNPYYANWQTSAHGKAGVACAECHYEPNAQSYVRNKIVGLSEVVKTATGTEDYKPMAVVSDESCLRSGCHTTAALEKAPVLLAGRVSISHGDHLDRTLRGVEVRCTVCHTMTRADQHFSINEEACFLCHFKGRHDSPTSAGECLTCHASIRTMPIKGGFSHETLVASNEPVDCATCHRGVTPGDGRVKDECSSCHLQDTQQLLRGNLLRMHQIHVTNKGVWCDRCHEKIRHGTNAPVVVAAAPSSPTAVPTQTTSGAPPKLAASHVGRAVCLVCHTAGIGGAPPVPKTNPDHAAFKDDNNASLCLMCH